MVKRWLSIGMILLLVSVVAIGCGVPQKDYEAVVTERDSIQAQLEQLSVTKDKLRTVEAESVKISSQLRDVTDQLSNKSIELLTAQGRLKEAERKVEAYQKVYPLKEFKDLSELNKFLNFNARLWQLDILDMLGKPQFDSVDFALLLQAAANKEGYCLSVQLDKATGHAFNTAFMGDTVYAVEPQYIIGSDKLPTNKVWIYAQRTFGKTS